MAQIRHERKKKRARRRASADGRKVPAQVANNAGTSQRSRYSKIGGAGLPVRQFVTDVCRGGR